LLLFTSLPHCVIIWLLDKLEILKVYIMIEIWDAYDKYFNKIDGVQLVRGKEIDDGIYHLVCDIIVRHTDGTYLLMQRDFKKHFGGMWELTAGGSALAGETPFECAIRELREETGIISSDLKEIKRIAHEGHRSIYVEYLCVTDWDKNRVTLQKGETVDFMWVEKDTVLKMGANELASTRALEIIREAELN